jgi:hypothetical protein
LDSYNTDDSFDSWWYISTYGKQDESNHIE